MAFLWMCKVHQLRANCPPCAPPRRGSDGHGQGPRRRATRSAGAPAPSPPPRCPAHPDKETHHVWAGSSPPPPRCPRRRCLLRAASPPRPPPRSGGQTLPRSLALRARLGGMRGGSARGGGQVLRGPRCGRRHRAGDEPQAKPGGPKVKREPAHPRRRRGCGRRIAAEARLGRLHIFGLRGNGLYQLTWYPISSLKRDWKGRLNSMYVTASPQPTPFTNSLLQMTAWSVCCRIS